MTTDDFLYLVEKVSPLIEKKNTVMRNAIPADERLALTLRYLATGKVYFSVLRVSFQSLPQSSRSVAKEGGNVEVIPPHEELVNMEILSSS
jgi:hypothetical protein